MSELNWRGFSEQCVNTGKSNWHNLKLSTCVKFSLGVFLLEERGCKQGRLPGRDDFEVEFQRKELI